MKNPSPGMVRFWLPAALAVAVLYGAMGLFVRPMADELCLVALAEEAGVTGAVSVQYWNWSGNVIGLYYQIVGAVFGLQRIAPAFLLTLWIICFAWLSHEILAAMGVPSRREATLLAGVLLTLAMFGMSPSLVQSFYWLNGTANYAPSSAAFVLLLALILRVARCGVRRAHYVAGILLALLAVMGQITLAVYVVGVLVPLLAGVIIFRGVSNRGALIRLLVCVLISGAVGAGIVMLSPGNGIRQDVLDSLGLMRQGFLRTAVDSWVYAAGMLFGSLFLYGPVAHIFLFGIGFSGGLALQSRSVSRKRIMTGLLISVVGGWYVFYLGAFAPAYTVGMYAPPRAWIVPHSGWVVILVLMGCCVGLLPKRLAESPLKRWLPHVLIGVFLVFQTASALNLLPMMRTFAEDHDARVALIEAATARGETVVRVPPYRISVDALALLQISIDDSCMQTGYGLSALIVESGAG